jgi:hypothetical protein
LQLRCASGAVRGQKNRASKVQMLQKKLKQKKFQRWRFLDFVFKFYSHKIFKPLTLTLSPQAGRGDWKEFIILKIEIILNFRILLISFLA